VSGGGSTGTTPAPKLCDFAGKKYDPSTHCVENNRIVAKVAIWKCKRYANMGPVGYVIWHHYLCCDKPNGTCYGMVPGVKKGKPVPQETQKGGTCTKHMVCPAVYKKCNNPIADCDYGAILPGYEN
jgi:hypothetical protein